jgi:NitT/TauT family transport system ATP-binding protein
MAAENILTVTNLRKRFGAHTVIENLSFSIRRHQRVAIFAPSGAGKTTLLSVIAGLQTLDVGSFSLNEEDTAIIFQEPRLFPQLAVRENILLPLKIHDKEFTPEVEERYRRWMEVCELLPFAGHYPHQLSGGMKQKVSLIRGLLNRPRFVMMDEPFQSIGIKSKKAIVDHLLSTDPQISILLITHDLEEVSVIAQKLLFFPSPILGRYIEMDAQNINIRQVLFPAENCTQEVFYDRQC